MRGAVAGYLTGRLPLDSAAVRFSDAMRRWGDYLTAADEEPSNPGKSVATISPILLAPPGYREDDPRIQELYDRATLLDVGPARFEGIQKFLRAHNKSSEPPPRP